MKSRQVDTCQSPPARYYQVLRYNREDDGPVMKPRSGQELPGQVRSAQPRPAQAMAAVQLGAPWGRPA